MKSADNNTTVYIVFIYLSILIFIAIPTLTLNVQQSILFIRISKYSTDVNLYGVISTTVLCTAPLAVSLIMSEGGNNKLIVIFFILACSIVNYMLARVVSDDASMYFAFRGPAETDYREFLVFSRSYENGRGVRFYSGYIRNGQYVAKIRISQNLYQQIGLEINGTCINELVQQQGMNERIVLLHRVVDLRDISTCQN